MANPFSVGCVDAGGESMSYGTPEDEIRYLQGGHKCEERTLYRY